MKNVARRSLPRAVQAIVLAASIATQAGGREPSVRLVSIHGTRVHLRSGIPVQLDHTNVTSHLSRGEVFAVDRISYGISATGDGMDGVWLHSTSVRDPRIAGWICGRYVAEVATSSASQPDKEPGSGSTDESRTSPSIPAIIIAPPPPSNPSVGLLTNILSIMNSLLSMIVLLAPVVGVNWFLGRLMPAWPATVNAAPVQFIIPPSPPLRGAGSPNNFYGKRWWISARR